MGAEVLGGFSQKEAFMLIWQTGMSARPGAGGRASLTTINQNGYSQYLLSNVILFSFHLGQPTVFHSTITLENDRANGIPLGQIDGSVLLTVEAYQLCKD